MGCRALDSGHDWIFGQSQLVGLDALKQDIQTRLLSWLGDCFFSPDEGVDYDTYLDIGTQGSLIQDMRRVLSLTPGVIRIDKMESALTDRILRVEFTVSTKYGDISDSVTTGGFENA